LNTWAGNEETLNTFAIINKATNIAVTDDDTYKRIITWHAYKGDGKQITITWMKRRVARFLYGVNGTDYTTPTQNVSVIVDQDTITITVLSALVRITTSALLDTFALNEVTPNQLNTSSTTFQVPASALLLQEGINTGALETPYQFNVICRIGLIGITQ
jgi:hypothetical protein